MAVLSQPTVPHNTTSPYYQVYPLDLRGISKSLVQVNRMFAKGAGKVMQGSNIFSSVQSIKRYPARVPISTWESVHLYRKSRKSDSLMSHSNIPFILNLLY